MPYVISKACTKCGACLFECPTGAIVEGKTQYYIDVDACAEHRACVNVCPVDAISLKPPSAKKEDPEEEE